MQDVGFLASLCRRDQHNLQRTRRDSWSLEDLNEVVVDCAISYVLLLDDEDTNLLLLREAEANLREAVRIRRARTG